MKIYIFLFLILIILGGLTFFYSRESFINYSFIDDAHTPNKVFMYPDFILKKADREEKDKLLEDDSDILNEVKPSQLLRGVDELMAVSYTSDNIYDATAANNGKTYTHNLTNW